LVLAEPGRHRDAAYLADAITRHGITHVHFVPSMLQAFLEEAKAASLPGLRRVLCSGEELTPALQEAFFQRMGGIELHNLYGPTEAAIDVTWWACERDPARRSVPIGHAIANTSIHVLDRQLSEVPVGVAGEIYIGGIQPARGYLDRFALTAERFLPDPLAGRPGARMYRTGDLGRRLPGGEIEYLGRIDQQVKIRGVRIEFGEIEATLLKVPGVRDAAVVLDQAEGSPDKRLVAYYVRHADHAVDKQDLRRSLQEKLPINMVPALYVELDAFPLTPSGKLNRKALPRPQLARAELGGEIVAPRSPLEALIIAIWIETLGVDRVGVEDDFFQLGGHSLIAIQMLSRLRDRAGIDLSVSRFFNVPTPALLAAEVRRRAPDPEALEARADALLKVSSLSEEEVEAMLSVEGEHSR
ncbi:MAG: AMP-binding protein, partial [Thermoanaerobaculia bacterium]